MDKQKVKVGVIVGRFQTPVLSDGHTWLIEKVQDMCGTLVVFIGVREGQPTKRNPLNFQTRRQMVKSSYPNANIFQIHDQPSDIEWSKNLDQNLAMNFSNDIFDATLYGCRDSFAEHYHGVYKTVILNCPAPEVNSTDMRAQFAKHPINSVIFRAGVIYGIYNRFHSPYLCVDVAVMRGNDVLLCKKPGEDKMRFIGGFVDSNDSGITAAAKRELWEEAKVTGKNFRIIGEAKINDWRYHNSETAVFTNLVLCEHDPRHQGVARDDIESIHWENLPDLSYERIMPEHHKLFEILFNHYTINTKNPCPKT